MTPRHRSLAAARAGAAILHLAILVGPALGPRVSAQSLDTSSVRAAIRAEVMRPPESRDVVLASDRATADSVLFRCLRPTTARASGCTEKHLPRVLVISELQSDGKRGTAVARLYAANATRDGMSVTEIEYGVVRDGSSWRATPVRVTMSEELLDTDPPGENDGG